MKVFRLAHGAQVGCVDPLGRYTGGAQLVTVGLRQIEVHPSLPSELSRHFGPNLVTALPNTRTDRGMKAGRRLRPKTLPHALDGAPNNLSHRAAPSGVDGGYGTVLLVYQKNRNAVGCAYRHRGTRCVFQQGVAYPEHASAAARCHAGRGMHLFERRQLRMQRRDIDLARAETMIQPGQIIEFPHAEDMLRIPIEHN